MNIQEKILQKSQELAKKPTQLTAFLEGVECGAGAANPDIRMTAEWMETARSQAQAVISTANNEANLLLRKAQGEASSIRANASNEASSIRANASNQAQRLQTEYSAKIARVNEEIEQLENNPKHLAAKSLMRSLLEQAGYSEFDLRGNRREIPSNVLCHIATMVAAVAGDNPVSISFGAKDGRG